MVHFFSYNLVSGLLSKMSGISFIFAPVITDNFPEAFLGLAANQWPTLSLQT